MRVRHSIKLLLMTVAILAIGAAVWWLLQHNGGAATAA
jgi:hypothetical protein